MNRTIFSLLVLLLFGLFSQPSIAQSSKNQQNAENKVARMSEEQMRTELQAAKARQKELQSVLNVGNYTEFYGQGDDDISKGLSKALAPAEYDYVTAIINAIEKRLSEIEEKRRQEEEKKKKEQEELERQKKEQEELERQRQEEFQESFERNLKESQERYNQLHTDVDNNSEAIREDDRALNRATGEIDPNSVRVTDEKLDKTLSPTSETNSGERDGSIGISDKFKENKLEETKEEESEDDKRRRELIEKVQNHLNSLEK